MTKTWLVSVLIGVFALTFVFTYRWMNRSEPGVRLFAALLVATPAAGLVALVPKVPALALGLGVLCGLMPGALIVSLLLAWPRWCATCSLEVGVISAGLAMLCVVVGSIAGTLIGWSAGRRTMRPLAPILGGVAGGAVAPVFLPVAAALIPLLMLLLVVYGLRAAWKKWAV